MQCEQCVQSNQLIDFNFRAVLFTTLMLSSIAEHKLVALFNFSFFTAGCCLAKCCFKFVCVFFKTRWILYVWVFCVV